MYKTISVVMSKLINPENLSTPNREGRLYGVTRTGRRKEWIKGHWRAIAFLIYGMTLLSLKFTAAMIWLSTGIEGLCRRPGSRGNSLLNSADSLPSPVTEDYLLLSV